MDDEHREIRDMAIRNTEAIDTIKTDVREIGEKLDKNISATNGRIDNILQNHLKHKVDKADMIPKNRLGLYIASITTVISALIYNLDKLCDFIMRLLG